MSLTIKAATAMHFAGAAYAAGDTIDTTAMDDRSIAVLLKHQPVYVASAASSATGAPCWFINADNPALAATITNTVFPQLSALTDGIAAGTDVIVDLVDPTKLRVVTPGTYLVGGQASRPDAVAYDTYRMFINKNTGSVGPEYYVVGDAGGIAATAHATALFPPVATVLQADDTLQVEVLAIGGTGDATLNQAIVNLIKVGDVPN